jgi:hypothetical protein
MRLVVSLFSLLLVLFTPLSTIDAAQNSAFKNVKIATPKIKYQVQGEAKLKKGQYNYLVRADHKILVKGSDYASKSAPNWGKLNKEISLTKQQVKGKKKITLELYQKKAGKIINKLVVPLDRNYGKTYQNSVFRKVKVNQPKVEYVVTGKARVFEAVFGYEVEDGHNILAKGFAQASHGAPEWGNFKIVITIPKKDLPVNGAVMLILYEEDMSGEGNRIHEYVTRMDQFPW